MRLLKRIAVQCILASCICGTAFAADVEDHPAVAVMDFGRHVGASSSDIQANNTEKTVLEYIIEALLESGHYRVIDKDLVAERIAAENLNTEGIIDPDTARRIGEILGVRYIIYGNLNDVTGSSTGMSVVSNGADVHTVQAHIIARMMDVTTGDIVMAAKGEGKSKSSLVKVSPDLVNFITIGTKKVSQVSVHNAIKKAAFAMVEKVSERLYGKEESAKKK